MKREAKQLLWLDDHRGVYIPRDFALSFRDRDSCVTGVSAEDWADLEAGPHMGLDSKGEGSETYWDTWQDVCDNAEVTDTDGTVYTLWQDGTLWLLEDGAQSAETADECDRFETGWYVEFDDPNAVELTAPSHWASYFINGDDSGLEPGEKVQADAWLAHVGLGDPVDCVDAGFIHSHDARIVGALPADCQTYTFIKRESQS